MTPRDQLFNDFYVAEYDLRYMREFNKVQKTLSPDVSPYTDTQLAEAVKRRDTAKEAIVEHFRCKAQHLVCKRCIEYGHHETECTNEPCY